jgi:chorismate mutase
MLKQQSYPSLLHPASAKHPSTNVNSQILKFYVQAIVPGITKGFTGGDDDGNYGSAATRDVEVLQALSRRIHFGELFPFQ